MNSTAETLAKRAAMRGVPDRCGVQPKPQSHTNARPGSEAKLLILQARAAAGEKLHHDDDRR